MMLEYNIGCDEACFFRLMLEQYDIRRQYHRTQGRGYQSWYAPETCPIDVCVTLSGKFLYAPYNYLTNRAGSEQTSDAVNNNKGLGKAT